MSAKDALRVMVVVGLALLAGCRGNKPTPIPEPSPTVMVDDGTSMPEHGEITPTQVAEPEREGDLGGVSGPASVAEVIHTPSSYQLRVEVDGAGFRHDSGEDLMEGRSIAYYFLRDRSRSVYEICGEDLYASSMKEIPDLLFTFLKTDTYFSGADIFVGLGNFPRDGKNAPTLMETQPLTKVEDIKLETWEKKLDSTWDSTFNVSYDAAVFMDSVKEAVDNLRMVSAESRKLIIFGDSLLDFPGGEREWEALMPRSDGTSLLTLILQNNNDDPSDDIELHYVQYDCLPDASTRSVIRDEFWRNGISNWQKLQSPEDRHDIDQIDDDPLIINDLIRVYGWKWYASSVHEERVWANLEPTQPPMWQVSLLLRGLLDTLLPSFNAQFGNLWQLQRYFGDTGTPSSDASSDTNSVEVRVPVPGYATGVTIHMLSFDDVWRIARGRYTLNGDPSTIVGPRGLKYTTYYLILDKLDEMCEGTTILLAPSDPSATASKYPVLVWWEIKSAPIPPLVVELQEVSSLPESAPSVTVPLRTYLDLDWYWEKPGDPSSGGAAFVDETLADACYLVDITHHNRLFEISDKEDSTARLSLKLDPLANSPAEGLDLMFDIVVERKVNVSNFTSKSIETTERQVVASSGDGTLPIVRFEFAPTLEGSSAKLDNSNPSYISYDIPVHYMSSAYYPAGSAPGQPVYYFLRRDNDSNSVEGCVAPTMGDDIRFELDGEVWASKKLKPGTGGKLVKDVGLDRRGDLIKITLIKKAIDKCGYVYLLIDWGDDAFTPISCDLRNGSCQQPPQFKPGKSNKPKGTGGS